MTVHRLIFQVPCDDEVILIYLRETLFLRRPPNVVLNPGFLIGIISELEPPLSNSCATLAVIWGLFVIFSGALSGRHSDISASAQKPQSGVTHN